MSVSLKAKLKCAAVFLFAGITLFSGNVLAATYEAENAILSGGAKTNTDHIGYTGTGFVDGCGNATAQSLFTVSSEAAGSYTVILRYSAGNGTSTNVGLYVNGTKIKNITCSGTGNWDSWGVQTETVTLNSGTNTVAYRTETASNLCINIDNLNANPVGQIGTYEAENASLSSGAKTNTNHSGYTGAGFVDGIGGNINAQTLFTVSAASAGSYTATLRYSAGSGTMTDMGLYVNGTKIKNVTCNGTGNWDSWGVVTETVTLNSGTNTVAYKAETAALHLNIDNLLVVAIVPNYTLAASTIGSGTVSRNPSGPSYPANSQVACTAVPASGWRFANWTGDLTGTVNPTSIIMNSNKNILATFTQNSFVITATAGSNGTISPSGAVTVNYGASQAFTITPTVGYRIATVLVDGASVGAISSYTFNNVIATHTIAASFAAIVDTISATASTGATISPSGNVIVTYGNSQSFTMTASTGYQISNVIVDGVSVGALTSYTFTNVIRSHTISVQVTALTYTLTVSNSGNGATTPSGSISVQHGAATAILATPASGYIFSSWTLFSGTASITNPSMQTTQVTLANGNATVTANFIPVTQTIPTNKQLSISGNLTDASGIPLGNSAPVTIDATVRIFAASTGGDELYNESFISAQSKGIIVDKGLFVVRLGTGTTTFDLPSVIGANPNMFVEITIEGASPDVLLPRTPLTAAAYSISTAAAVQSVQTTLHGSGAPANSINDAAVGTSYIDDVSKLSWIRVSSGWKLVN